MGCRIKLTPSAAVCICCVLPVARACYTSPAAKSCRTPAPHAAAMKGAVVIGALALLATGAHGSSVASADTSDPLKGWTNASTCACPHCCASCSRLQAQTSVCSALRAASALSLAPTRHCVIGYARERGIRALLLLRRLSRGSPSPLAPHLFLHATFRVRLKAHLLSRSIFGTACSLGCVRALRWARAALLWGTATLLCAGIHSHHSPHRARA